MYTSADMASVARMEWLLYYNRVLFEKGIISEKERNQMTNKIRQSKGRKNIISPIK